MNRRHFLTTLAAGLAAASDPERFLWISGAKTIFIPPIRSDIEIVGDLYIRHLEHFKIGDILRFGDDSLKWIVTSVGDSDGIGFGMKPV